MLWLEENDDQSLEYMYNAIDKDKKEGVQSLHFIFQPTFTLIILFVDPWSNGH